MEDKRYDPYTGYEIKDEDSTQEYHTQDDDPYRRYRYEDDHIEQPQQEQTSGIAIITGIAAIICFAVTPKVNETRGNKAKAGLICGIIGIIGSVILITVFVVNILLSSDFQNEMKEFNTHYDTYIDENDDSI